MSGSLTRTQTDAASSHSDIIRNNNTRFKVGNLYQRIVKHLVSFGRSIPRTIHVPIDVGNTLRPLRMSNSRYKKLDRIAGAYLCYTSRRQIHNGLRAFGKGKCLLAINRYRTCIDAIMVAITVVGCRTCTIGGECRFHSHCQHQIFA